MSFARGGDSLWRRKVGLRDDFYSGSVKFWGIFDRAKDLVYFCGGKGR